MDRPVLQDRERPRQRGPARGSDLSSVIGVLEDQHMPPVEIRAVVMTEDPEFVRRVLELHRERLDEWLADQRRRLWEVERFLVDAATERHRIRDVGASTS